MELVEKLCDVDDDGVKLKRREASIDEDARTRFPALLLPVEEAEARRERAIVVRSAADMVAGLWWTRYVWWRGRTVRYRRLTVVMEMAS